MQYNEFAKSGRQVSRIGFGAMGLNCAFGQFDQDYLIRAVLNSLEQGVSFIDTARTYGESEEILGKALKQWSGERPFIASKAAPQASSTNAGWGIPNPIEIAYPRGDDSQCRGIAAPARYRNHRPFAIASILVAIRRRPVAGGIAGAQTAGQNQQHRHLGHRPPPRPGDFHCA